MIKISGLSRKSEKENKHWFETPYENLSAEQQNEARQKFCTKLADFLFTRKATIRAIMRSKIFDRVIDGAEYQLIKYRHFIRLIKRAGFSLSYNDEMAIKNIFNPVLKGCIDIANLEDVLKTLGIEDEMPPYNKHLDYKKLKSSSIRLFNKIFQRMNEIEAETVIEFLGPSNIEYIQIVTKDKKEAIEVISNYKLREVLREQGVINYGVDLDDEFLEFVALDEDTCAIRKLKRAIREISR